MDAIQNAALPAEQPSHPRQGTVNWTLHQNTSAEPQDVSLPTVSGPSSFIAVDEEPEAAAKASENDISPSPPEETALTPSPDSLSKARSSTAEIPAELRETIKSMLREHIDEIERALESKTSGSVATTYPSPASLHKQPFPRLPRSRPEHEGSGQLRLAWPPPPTVEDEAESLAREFGSSASSRPSDEEPKCRGDPEQIPILTMADEANAERRFILISNDSEDIALTPGSQSTLMRTDMRTEGGRIDLPKIEMDLIMRQKLSPRANSATGLNRRDREDFYQDYYQKALPKELFSPDVVRRAAKGRNRSYVDLDLQEVTSQHDRDRSDQLPPLLIPLISRSPSSRWSSDTPVDHQSRSGSSRWSTVTYTDQEAYSPRRLMAVRKASPPPRRKDSDLSPTKMDRRSTERHIKDRGASPFLNRSNSPRRPKREDSQRPINNDSAFSSSRTTRRDTSWSRRRGRSISPFSDGSEPSSRTRQLSRPSVTGKEFMSPPKLHTDRSHSSLDYLESSKMLTRPLSINLGAKFDLPPCPRAIPTAGRNDWLTIPRCRSFNVCPTCYDAVFASTEFGRLLVPALFRGNKKVACDLGSSHWCCIAWSLTKEKRLPDLRLLCDIANIRDRYQSCPLSSVARRDWYSVRDPLTNTHIPGFQACQNCVRCVELFFPSVTGIFVRDEFPRDSMCALRYLPGREAFLEYFAAFKSAHGESVSPGLQPISSLTADIRRISSIPDCRGSQMFGEQFYVMQSLPELTVCLSCFEDIVWPQIIKESYVGRKFYMYPQRFASASCQLSITGRMRAAFLEACRRNDMGYLESEFREMRSEKPNQAPSPTVEVESNNQQHGTSEARRHSPPSQPVIKTAHSPPLVGSPVLDSLETVSARNKKIYTSRKYSSSRESTAESHLLPELSGKLSQENWVSLLANSHVPESLQCELQFSDVLGTGGCWTCTPSDPEEVVPLTIAGSPVVLPVEYHYPLTAATLPPPDPHPHFISPIEPLGDDVVEEIFDLYEEAAGLFVLINGMLQIIIPEGFDYEHAISHLPNEFGGLKVSFIPQSLIATAGESIAQPSTTTEVGNQNQLPWAVNRQQTSVSAQVPASDVSSLRIGSTVRVSMKNNRGRERFEGKLGVRTESNGKCFVTIPTHLITDALANSRNVSLQSKSWAEHIKILAGNRNIELGPVAETFDPTAQAFPTGFLHDITLIDISNIHPTTVSEIKSPIAIGWLSQQDWASIKFNSRKLFLLDDQERDAKSIAVLPSRCQIVGQGILKVRQKSKGQSFLSSLFGERQEDPRDSLDTWTSLVARSVLFRVHPDFPTRGGQSGTPVCLLDESENAVPSAKLAGFSSFVQMVSDVQRYDMEGDKLDKRLSEGRVAFYGAFEVPRKLREMHTIR